MGSRSARPVQGELGIWRLALSQQRTKFSCLGTGLLRQSGDRFESMEGSFCEKLEETKVEELQWE